MGFVFMCKRGTNWVTVICLTCLAVCCTAAAAKLVCATGNVEQKEGGSKHPGLRANKVYSNQIIIFMAETSSFFQRSQQFLIAVALSLVAVTLVLSKLLLLHFSLLYPSFHSDHFSVSTWRTRLN